MARALVLLALFLAAASGITISLVDNEFHVCFLISFDAMYIEQYKGEGDDVYVEELLMYDTVEQFAGFKGTCTSEYNYAFISLPVVNDTITWTASLYFAGDPPNLMEGPATSWYLSDVTLTEALTTLLNVSYTDTDSSPLVASSGYALECPGELALTDIEYGDGSFQVRFDNLNVQPFNVDLSGNMTANPDVGVFDTCIVEETPPKDYSSSRIIALVIGMVICAIALGYLLHCNRHHYVRLRNY
eukprot:m.86480 g.86480  ORF g.86480 m.86480 type:complete len:244 (+) comp13555_c0_seq2:1263-1994(+)